MNDELLCAASVKDVVRDAAIVELLAHVAPPPEPALCSVAQFDVAPHEFTVTDLIIHSLTTCFCCYRAGDGE